MVCIVLTCEGGSIIIIPDETTVGNDRHFTALFNSKWLIHLIQCLLQLDPGAAMRRIKKRPQWAGPCCGEKMIVLETRLPP